MKIPGMSAADLADLLKLPPDQRLDLIEALWDSLDADDVPMPDWHKDVLDEREANEEADLGDTWDVVKSRLEKKL
jgi:putative addiction module component (TIGR02574 family)